MFISATDASRLMLPCVRWAGDVIVTHRDGTSEIVRDPLVGPLGHYICPQGYRIHDPDFGCAHKPLKELKTREICG